MDTEADFSSPQIQQMVFASDSIRSHLSSRRVQIVALLLSSAALFVVGLYFYRREFYEAISSYVEWAQSLGPIGLTFVSVGVFLCQFLPMPFLYIGLCVLSSFTFGFFQSFVPLYFGTISGMIAVWIVCLTSLRPWLMSQISHLDAFRHVHRELDAHQWKIVLILRLSPIPVGLQNFVLSLILSGGDAFWRYMVGSCCIVLPETLVYMAIGGTIKDVSEFVLGEATPTPWESGLMALQMLGAVCFLAGIITIGSRLVKDVYANLSENESCELPLPANSATQAIPRRKHMCDDIF